MTDKSKRIPRAIITVGAAKRLTRGVGIMFLELAGGRQDTPT